MSRGLSFSSLYIFRCFTSPHRLQDLEDDLLADVLHAAVENDDEWNVESVEQDCQLHNLFRSPTIYVIMSPDFQSKNNRIENCNWERFQRCANFRQLLQSNITSSRNRIDHNQAHQASYTYSFEFNWIYQLNKPSWFNAWIIRECCCYDVVCITQLNIQLKFKGAEDKRKRVVILWCGCQGPA